MSGGVIIAVDFDGTVVEHDYPDVGRDVPGAVAGLRELASKYEARLILWTMRSGQTLDDAKAWYAKHGIPLFGVNGNPDQHKWTDSPKAFAQIYIDDAALGAPLKKARKEGKRPMVDWKAVMETLRARFDDE